MEEGLVGEANTLIEEGKRNGMGAYGWETGKGNNIRNVIKKKKELLTIE